MINDALGLQDAGAFAIVVEGVVGKAGEAISQSLSIPTIGIGAGAGCDGQVLVFHDVFGIFNDFVPKFVKKYADVNKIITKACKNYINDVKNGVFPAQEHTF